MFNTEAMFGLAVTRVAGGAKSFEGSLESVDSKPVGEISNCMDIDLIALSCPVKCKPGQCSCIDEQ
jgi:hypothetical protein